MDAIKVVNLRFTYPNQPEETIKSISFNVEKGTIFGLLGPSGAGKSTTQKILTKLIGDYEGSVEFLGKDLKSYKKDFYENVGVGFEMPIHFNKLTALENLKYFAALYKKNIDYVDLLRKVGLYDAKDQQVGNFSKGMKVRLNFVRAMLNDPDVLFLDEPTNGLDPKNARVMKDLIMDCRRQGKTIIITTHLMGDVEQLCDQVVFMTKGKLSEMSSPRELKIKHGTREVTLEYRENNERVSVKYPLEGLGTNPEFLAAIQTKPIETIHSGETSLEEIFIKVTGEAKYD
ncbi:MAG: ABC transporter ATP-binding protein [Bacillus subtilis]|nr:ABC transporter ATP-binding protein [Bacillus subtilis]